MHAIGNESKSEIGSFGSEPNINFTELTYSRAAIYGTIF